MSKFSPGKLMTAFFVFFFPILIFLGSWQIVRGLDKESIVSQHRLNQSMPVINEDQIKEFSQEELVYRTISLEGAFGEQTYIWTIDFIGKKQVMKFLQFLTPLKILLTWLTGAGSQKLW
jgi:cytochrome oxidase assembly protein ShyY1